MTTTVEPAGVSDATLTEMRDRFRESARPDKRQYAALFTELLAARQQLADSAHEVERLNAANAAMRGDAARYRWLRSKGAWKHVDPPGLTGISVYWEYGAENDSADPRLDAAIDAHIAALAPTSHDPVRSAGEPVPSRGKCETAWLIEWRDGPQPKWLGEYAWVTDANEAIWYARKSDADAAHKHQLKGTRKAVVCEHMFIDCAQPSIPKSVAKRIAAMKGVPFEPERQGEDK